MTDQLEALRNNVVAAVQEELNRYNEVVSAEIQRLRAEVAAERTARARTEEQLMALAGAAQRQQQEIDARIGRIADETNKGLAAAVQSAAVPIVKQLEHRQDGLETSLAALDRTVRKFDDQAGKIVAHINAVTEATDARIDEVTGQVSAQLDGRLAGLSARVDEVSAQAARQQAEVSNVVGQRVDQAEARINERLLTTEARINDEVGQRVADIDAYVGRVSVGLDEAVTMLSDRIAATDSRFAEVNAALTSFATRLDSRRHRRPRRPQGSLRQRGRRGRADPHRDRALPGVDGLVDGQGRGAASSNSRPSSRSSTSTSRPPSSSSASKRSSGH
jgi:chromosome segregation ATPase